MSHVPSPVQLLVWSSYTGFTYEGHGNTITGMLNLTDDSVMEANITNTKHDMFCPGARCRTYLRFRKRNVSSILPGRGLTNATSGPPASKNAFAGCWVNGLRAC